MQNRMPHAFCIYTLAGEGDFQRLDQQSFDLLLDVLDLRLQVGRLVRCHGRGYNRPRHATCTTESRFGWNEDVCDIFVLAEKRQVQKDLQRLRVCSHYNELRDAAVKGLGGYITPTEAAGVRRGCPKPEAKGCE
ncbi:MAG: hypothetical protein BJ554DRAFT_2820 [Olpidium bornovanus]|uniref:Uncharacterized protein n=1 Tax=Olpidium bornovanus TaxID=278681 RepID=A0A8H8DGC1_9FUNG|nr:MAG: hypothetical protein BJ554DRAFT_2820 [Olpidium bornovanus]